MTAKRKRHKPEFKAQVALEAYKGDKTINQLASEHEEKSGAGLSLCTAFVVYEDKKKIFSECKA